MSGVGTRVGVAALVTRLTRRAALGLFALSAPISIAQITPPTQAIASAAAQERAGVDAQNAGKLREAFLAYVAALNALPDPPPIDDDFRIRQRVILLVGQMNPPPNVPDQAKEIAAQGIAALETARDQAGYASAAARLRAAVRIAPWWAQLAYNLGLVEEKLLRPQAAIANLHLYLLADPQSSREPQIRAHIRELEGQNAGAAAGPPAAEAVRDPASTQPPAPPPAPVPKPESHKTAGAAELITGIGLTLGSFAVVKPTCLAGGGGDCPHHSGKRDALAISLLIGGALFTIGGIADLASVSVIAQPGGVVIHGRLRFGRRESRFR